MCNNSYRKDQGLTQQFPYNPALFHFFHADLEREDQDIYDNRKGTDASYGLGYSVLVDVLHKDSFNRLLPGRHAFNPLC